MCRFWKETFFSHGNFIRDLAEDEIKELKKYKKDLAAFKKKIDEAFANAEVLEKSNSTIPPMPIRPSMPSFCSKPDTTLYVFAGCTVQNYKVYIGGKFARDLSMKEKKQLDEFSKTVSKPQNPQNGTETATTVKPPDATKINLDFCTEF